MSAAPQGYWRGLEELFDRPGFRQQVAREFPALARRVPDMDRRALFRCLGAAVALAGLDGCERQAAEDSFPLARMPEGGAPGSDRFYATAVELDGIGQPVIGKCRDGRPIKLEGNPDHPASGGATDAFTQAALLGLYDPERAAAPRRKGEPATWGAAEAMLQDLRMRLDATEGEGLRLLTGPVGSPTLLRQIAAMRGRWPRMGWHVHAATPPLRRRVLHLEAAHAVVCLDADPLGNGPLQTWHAKGWSARRRAFQEGDGGARLLVAEPAPSLTGVAAQDRLIVRHGRIGHLLAAIEARLLPGAALPHDLLPEETAWVQAAAAALDRHRGRGLLLIGNDHQPDLQARADAVNRALGNAGRTVRTQPEAEGGAPGDLPSLTDAMAGGGVSALFVLETNPVYSAPADSGFADALGRVPLTIAAGLHADETASRCEWLLPTAHLLESWSDVRCAEGTAGVVQPLVRPFLDVRSRHDVLALLTDGNAAGREAVRQTWRSAWEGDEDRWQRLLVSGMVPGSAPEGGEAPTAPAPAAAAPDVDRTGLEVLFRPDPCVHDGSLAGNPWLQEMPKPLTKLTWDNAVHISPGLAQARGLANEDNVEIAVGAARVTGPVWIVPGQARDTVVLHLGYGRREGSAVALGWGFDANALRTQAQPWRRAGASIRKLDERRELACTQTHWAMDGHDWVRHVERPGESLPEKPANASFYPPQPRMADEPAWGMAIDLDLCIGCNACAAACVAENNVPMVGREQVAMGREMHWLRIDRYYEGSPEAPRHAFQPVPCMHCENAPCEMGCPVNAAVHSPDGLNLQVYNRCIGTRTCSAYCPYKVRRFNWLDYTREAPPEIRAQRNPEVTVRDRGVMEKCTFCIQRIATTRIEADKQGRPIAEGEVRTACQQACPTQAIVFGDIARADSAVSRRKADGRDYALLEEANTRPRTTYSARIRSGEGEA